MSLEHGPAGALDPARGTRRYALGARNAPENAPLRARREEGCISLRRLTRLARIFCGERIPGVEDAIQLPCSSR